MKNKKGFTLIELLGIIIILAAIILLIIPIVDNSIQNRKKELYETQIDNIELALKNWGADNMFNLPDEENGSITVTLGQLKQSGFIDEDVLNPVTGECFPNDMLLTITKSGNNYEYEVFPESGSAQCDEEINRNAPIIGLKGKTVVYVEVNTPYVEPGLIVTKSDGTPISQDRVEKTITGPKNTIDTSVLGTYQITYTIEDEGSTSQIIRTVIVRDTIAPEITLEKVTTLSTLGETFDIMAGVSATDNSGVTPTITSNGSVNTSLTGTYTITYTATDPSGNKATEKRTVIVNDNGNPDIAITIVGSPFNSEGWANGDVTARVEARDTSSGVERIYTCVSKNGKCTPNTQSRNSIVNVTVAEESDNAYVCAYSVDTAGNKSETICTDKIKIDKIAPTCVTSGLTGTLGSEGWYRSAVSATGTCTDSGSGCAVKTVSNSYGANTANATLSPGTVTDLAGNTTKCPETTSFKIDLVAPTCNTQVNATMNNKGWYQGSSVTATGVCTDDLSGCTGNSSASVGEGRNTITPGIVSDKAGNTASCPGVYVQVDGTAPSNPDVSHSGSNADLSGGSDDSGICWYQVDGVRQESGHFADLAFGEHTAYAVDCSGNLSSGVKFSSEPSIKIVQGNNGQTGMWSCNGPGTNCSQIVWRDKLKTTITSATGWMNNSSQMVINIKGNIYTSGAWLYSGGSESYARDLCLGNSGTRNTSSTYCKSTSQRIKQNRNNNWNTKSTYTFDVNLTLDNPSGCYDVIIYQPGSTTNGHITTAVPNIICVQ